MKGALAKYHLGVFSVLQSLLSDFAVSRFRASGRSELRTELYAADVLLCTLATLDNSHLEDHGT